MGLFNLFKKSDLEQAYATRYDLYKDRISLHKKSGHLLSLPHDNELRKAYILADASLVDQIYMCSVAIEEISTDKDYHNEFKYKDKYYVPTVVNTRMSNFHHIFLPDDHHDVLNQNPETYTVEPNLKNGWSFLSRKTKIAHVADYSSYERFLQAQRLGGVFLNRKLKSKIEVVCGNAYELLHQEFEYLRERGEMPMRFQPSEMLKHCDEIFERDMVLGLFSLFVYTNLVVMTNVKISNKDCSTNYEKFMFDLVWNQKATETGVYDLRFDRYKSNPPRLNFTEEDKTRFLKNIELNYKGTQI